MRVVAAPRERPAPGVGQHAPPGGELVAPGVVAPSRPPRRRAPTRPRWRAPCRPRRRRPRRPPSPRARRGARSSSHGLPGPRGCARCARAASATTGSSHRGRTGPAGRGEGLRTGHQQRRIGVREVGGVRCELRTVTWPLSATKRANSALVTGVRVDARTAATDSLVDWAARRDRTRRSPSAACRRESRSCRASPHASPARRPASTCLRGRRVARSSRSPCRSARRRSRGAARP